MNTLQEIDAAISRAENRKMEFLRKVCEANTRADEVMNSLEVLRAVRDKLKAEVESAVVVRNHKESGKPYTSGGIDSCAVCGVQFHVASNFSGGCKGGKL